MANTRVQSVETRPRNKCRCPLQPAESFLARARAPPGARSDSVDVRARRPSPLHPAGPCSATPPALRLLPCAPLDVGRKDRFPLGTRLREDRARVVNAARARSPFPGTPVAVTWDPRLKTARSTARAPPLLLLPPPLRSPRQTRCRRSRRRRRRRRLAPRLRHRRPPSRGGVPLMARAPRSPARLAAAPLSPPLRSWPPPPLSIPPSAPPLPPPRASPPPPPPSPSPLSGARASLSNRPGRGAHDRQPVHTLSFSVL